MKISIYILALAIEGKRRIIENGYVDMGMLKEYMKV